MHAPANTLEKSFPPGLICIRLLLPCDTIEVFAPTLLLLSVEWLVDRLHQDTYGLR